MYSRQAGAWAGTRLQVAATPVTVTFTKAQNDGRICRVRPEVWNGSGMQRAVILSVVTDRRLDVGPDGTPCWPLATFDKDGSGGGVMFARTVTFTSATNIDQGITFLRDKVIPLLHEQKGFRGVTVSADETAGVLGVLSLWDTEEERDASEGPLAATRREHQQLMGGEVAVENFEEMVRDVTEPPSVGSWLLLRRVSMDPANIDENVEFFRREVLPQIKAGRGFRAVRNMINRQTGEGMVGTLWADRAAMEAAAEAAEERRRRVEPRVTFGEQSMRTIVYVDMLT